MGDINAPAWEECWMLIFTTVLIRSGVYALSVVFIQSNVYPCIYNMWLNTCIGLWIYSKLQNYVHMWLATYHNDSNLVSLLMVGQLTVKHEVISLQA